MKVSIECPKCEGRNTELVGEKTDTIDIYYCKTCKSTFEVKWS